MADPRVTAAIAALVDREPMAIAGSSSRTEASDDDLRLLRALHAMADGTCAGPPSDTEWRHPEDASTLVWFGRVGLGLALLQIAAGTVGFAMGYVAPRSIPAGAWFAALVGFTLAGAWLMLGGRTDARARALGAFYLVAGASFGLRFLPTGSPWLALLPGLSAQPFLPFFLWTFASRFPRTARASTADRICRWGLTTSVVVAGVLFAVKAIATLEVVPALATALQRYYAFGSDRTWGLLYWAPPFALLLPVVPVIVAKRRLAPVAECTRATVFVFGFGGVLLLGAGSLLLETFVPSFYTYVRAHRDVTAPMFIGGLLLAPLITTYAVLMDSLLEVRTVLTRGARYLLARYVTLVVSATPLGLLLAFLYLHRDETIGEVLSTGVGLTLVLTACAGAVLTLLRDRAVQYLDAHFGRTPVNLADETAALTAAIGDARTVEEAAEVVELALTRCLAAANVKTFRMNTSGTSLDAIGGDWPSIDSADALFSLLCTERVFVVLDGSPASVLALLPVRDRQWCERTDTQMVVPATGAAGRPRGAIAVGMKMTGDQFRRAEQIFVGTIAVALALKLDSLDAAIASSGGEADDDAARVCERCTKVAPVQGGSCECGGRLRPAAIPILLAGKFTATSYVGAGAMGVVYRAVDSTLNRTVALKTLSRLNGAAADRLASEARMMAAVAHPNLATIYGIERWRNAPILVLEYLERGTLASRLRAGLPIDEVLRLGILLAPALDQLHKSRILHRDIKPTNIGFTRDDAPKLLDFGLASVLADEPTGSAGVAADTPPDATDASRTQAVRLGEHRLVGTPLYIAPESLAGASPSPAQDLWSLSLVLFEAIAGRHPFAAATVPDVLEGVRCCGRLDLREYRPDCPSVVAATFSELLAPDPATRCQTATELRDALTRALAAGAG